MRGMPNQPKTPLLVARVPEERQAQLKALAAAEGVTVTALVNEAIGALLEKRALDEV